MAPRFRHLACLACLLAFAAPAHAANGAGPGALKKETTPAPAPAPAPAPTPSPKANPKAVPDTKSTPVNKGTGKKLGQTQAAATPAAGSTTTTQTVRRSTTRRREARAVARARRATPRRQAAARGRPLPVPVRARGTTGAPRGQVAAGQSSTAADQNLPTAAKAKAAGGRARPAHAQARRDDDPAPLTSLTQTADRVVEVIPGAIILALAALTALVLLLILRSLAVERQRGKALATSYGITVEALATAIEAKDLTTGGHIERVRRLGLLLAGEIVPREVRDPQMEYGFLLHDIGKLAVPDAILRAPGRLSEEQWALMRRHPEEGVQMLANVQFLDRALDVVRHHHERWDGGGYPDGLKGEQIPLWARIFAVIDALDAITAERPYRAARSYQSALEEIRRHSGTQFDPAVVEALEVLDPAGVEPLLEPAQQVAPLAELAPVEPLVAV